MATVERTGDRREQGRPRGAYGIALEGLGDAAGLLVGVDVDAPLFTVATEVGAPPPAPELVDDRRAELRLRTGGRILIDRDARSARFVVPRPLGPEELVHPYLAPAAAVIARWEGRESFHAGALGLDGRAVALLGPREAGKSSLLAEIASRGAGVVCDDMLVLDGVRALPGPRTLDLRRDAARALAAGGLIGASGARERWRVRLAGTSEEPRLAGWIVLAWGERHALRPLGAQERLERLLEHRAVRLPSADPRALVDLAALPGWELSRPRRWEDLAATAERVLELASR